MTCLSIEQIYLYIEKELSSAQNKEVQKHLAGCPKCQNAVQERKLLLEAAESLPEWEIPGGFTQQVMSRIFPARVSPLAWLGAAGAGVASLILAIVLYALVTGQNFLDILRGSYSTVLNVITNLSPLIAKILKLVSLLVKIIQQFGEFLVKGLTLLTSLISPQVQIIIITVAIVIIASSIYGLRRKLFIGEKA